MSNNSHTFSKPVKYHKQANITQREKAHANLKSEIRDKTGFDFQKKYFHYFQNLLI